MSKEIIVVGGGAAGMMAAIAAGEQGASVKLLEPNERLGKKLNITGKGRCNVTNHADLETLLANIPRNGKFLYSALSRFGSQDTMAFFEGLGVALKVERGERVFPVSDRAFDVSAALERRLKALRVTLLRERAESLLTEENAVQGVKTDRGIPGRRMLSFWPPAAFPIRPPAPPEKDIGWQRRWVTPLRLCRDLWFPCGKREISAPGCRD